MSVYAHERFGKLKCGKCPIGARLNFGCPYPHEEHGNRYDPPDAEGRERWPRWRFALPGHGAFETVGCPWPEFVENADLWPWVTAWEMLKRFGKTPVDLGFWPQVSGEYLEVMLHLDRLSDVVEEQRLEQMQHRAAQSGGMR